MAYSAKTEKIMAMTWSPPANSKSDLLRWFKREKTITPRAIPINMPTPNKASRKLFKKHARVIAPEEKPSETRNLIWNAITRPMHGKPEPDGTYIHRKDYPDSPFEKKFGITKSDAYVLEKILDEYKQQPFLVKVALEPKIDIKKIDFDKINKLLDDYDKTGTYKKEDLDEIFADKTADTKTPAPKKKNRFSFNKTST